MDIIHFKVNDRLLSLIEKSFSKIVVASFLRLPLPSSMLSSFCKQSFSKFRGYMEVRTSGHRHLGILEYN